MSHLTLNHSLLVTYENKNPRGVWDHEQYNWLIHNLCLDCKDCDLDEQQIAYELFSITYREKGLLEFAKYELGSVEEVYISFMNEYKKLYGVELDLLNEDLVIYNPSSCSSINF